MEIPRTKLAVEVMKEYGNDMYDVMSLTARVIKFLGKIYVNGCYDLYVGEAIGNDDKLRGSPGLAYIANIVASIPISQATHSVIPTVVIASEPWVKEFGYKGIAPLARRIIGYHRRKVALAKQKLLI
jgi:hypothetical protein